MKSHYWYLILDSKCKFVTVDKVERLFYDGYNFLNEVSPKIKKIIKKTLKYCPNGHKYIFAYTDNEYTFPCIKCVGIMRISVNNGMQLWENLCGEDFFKFCKNYDICVPEHHMGEFVFNTLEENVESNILKKIGEMYQVKDSEFVYPLRASY